MNSIYRRKTIKPDLSDPIKRKQWYRDKIYMFMHNKFSNPEHRKIFYEQLQKNEIPYEQLNEITKAMRKEENAKKEKYKHSSKGNVFSYKRNKTFK